MASNSVIPVQAGPAYAPSLYFSMKRIATPLAQEILIFLDTISLCNFSLADKQHESWCRLHLWPTLFKAQNQAYLEAHPDRSLQKIKFNSVYLQIKKIEKLFPSERSCPDNILRLNDDYNIDILFGAARKGCTDLLELIAMHKPNAMNKQKDYEFSLLQLAIHHSQKQSGEALTAVETLVQVKADVNERDYEGCTPLMRLASNQERLANNEERHHGRSQTDSTNIEEIAKCLIQNGSDLNAVDQNGFSALRYAVTHGDLGILRQLLKASTPPDINSQIRPRIQPFFDHIFKRGFPFEIPGTTSLMEAAYRKDVEAVEILLASHANVNLRDKNGTTALMCAYALSDFTSTEDVVGMLIRSGADIHAIDQQGRSVMSYACNNESVNVKILEDLFRYFTAEDRSKLLNTKDDNGKTPFEYFLDRNLNPHPLYPHSLAEDREIYEFLLDNGANIEQVNKYGETPIINYEMVPLPKSEPMQLNPPPHAQAAVMSPAITPPGPSQVHHPLSMRLKLARPLYQVLTSKLTTRAIIVIGAAALFKAQIIASPMLVTTLAVVGLYSVWKAI